MDRDSQGDSIKLSEFFLKRPSRRGPLLANKLFEESKHPNRNTSLPRTKEQAVDKKSASQLLMMRRKETFLELDFFVVTVLDLKTMKLSPELDGKLKREFLDLYSDPPPVECASARRRLLAKLAHFPLLVRKGLSVSV